MQWRNVHVSRRVNLANIFKKEQRKSLTFGSVVPKTLNSRTDKIKCIVGQLHEIYGGRLFAQARLGDNTV
jgi:hypothetical protein